ncbi:unnamed protein product [Psylliodes chrysocephalus]|uniref:Uncharacterized protein n=1 Tax=Psylliodes chrysocephalus TaxID=3402493 RepID=A0A9P0CTC4_9CUCU|nr:unnamed protein product [Psylliodes chrysocephala]
MSGKGLTDAEPKQLLYESSDIEVKDNIEIIEKFTDNQKLTSSKRMRYGDPNYENTPRRWCEEIGSNNSDISKCDENLAVETDHGSESEFNCNKYFKIISACVNLCGEETESEENDSEKSEEHVLERNLNFYFGKNRFNWTKKPLT